MTHHQFGTIAGSTETGGLFNLMDALLITERSTLAVKGKKGDVVPFDLIALELVGRVNKGDDTLQAVYVMSALEAGAIARMLWDAAEQIGDETKRDYEVGFRVGKQALEDD